MNTPEWKQHLKAYRAKANADQLTLLPHWYVIINGQIWEPCDNDGNPFPTPSASETPAAIG